MERKINVYFSIFRKFLPGFLPGTGSFNAVRKESIERNIYNNIYITGKSAAWYDKLYIGVRVYPATLTYKEIIECQSSSREN